MAESISVSKLIVLEPERSRSQTGPAKSGFVAKTGEVTKAPESSPSLGSHA